MGDRQSNAKKAKNDRKKAIEAMENAIVAVDVIDDSIYMYKSEEMETANDEIVSALAETKFVYEELEKNSPKKKEYEKEIQKLEQCKAKINRAKGIGRK